MKKPNVFIASSSLPSAKKVVQQLVSQLSTEFRLVPWYYANFQAGEMLLDSLLVKAKQCEYAIFVFEPDDLLHLEQKQGEAEPRAVVRDNVLLELGIFFGLVGVENTVILKHKKIERLPSDLQGVLYLEYEDEPENDLSSNDSLMRCAAKIDQKFKNTQQQAATQRQFYVPFATPDLTKLADINSHFAAKNLYEVQQMLKTILQTAVPPMYQQENNKGICSVVRVNQTRISTYWSLVERNKANKVQQILLIDRQHSVTNVDNAAFDVIGSVPFCCDGMKHKTVVDEQQLKAIAVIDIQFIPAICIEDVSFEGRVSQRESVMMCGYQVVLPEGGLSHIVTLSQIANNAAASALRIVDLDQAFDYSSYVLTAKANAAIQFALGRLK